MMTKEEAARFSSIVTAVVEYYRTSGDFNGIEFNRLLTQVGGTVEELATDLNTLSMIFRDISIVDSIHFGNPHVKSFDDLSADEQFKAIDRVRLPNYVVCLYPTEKLLKRYDQGDFRDKPFTRKLYLGEPQLRFCTFEISVLDSYYHDPRYFLDFDGVAGSLYMKGEFSEDSNTPERDKIYLQTFGSAYTDDGKRAIAVYLRYISRLSPEHQQIWNSKLVTGDFKLHSDYIRQTQLGDWHLQISMFAALIGELQEVNKISQGIGRPNLFRQDFQAEKPEGFEPIYVSTYRAYLNFVHTLDKMLSDNIDKSFFRNDIPLETEVQRKSDKKIIVTPKGTILLLTEWLTQVFPSTELPNISKVTDGLKDIRKIRQAPAHKIQSNLYDSTYYRQQHEILLKAYESIHALRLLLEKHPDLQGYTAPELLEESTIRKVF